MNVRYPPWLLLAACLLGGHAAHAQAHLACGRPMPPTLDGSPVPPSQSFADILPDVPDGVQAMSLLGEELVIPGPPTDGQRHELENARADYEQEPDDADNIIWYGRRLAYTGDYRGAIRIFSDGIEKFPADPRMFRHRGHRYISIRQLDRAIADLERAVSLIEGTRDVVEPDGAPNPAGIPVSTLHSNIRYHLGLAYYLNGDLVNAERVYAAAIARMGDDDFQSATRNHDDMLVATTHWRYMTLRLLGRDEDAARTLEPIKADMKVIESMAYHQLCLLYKGEGEMSVALDAGITPAGGDAASYGVGNWHFYNGRCDDAKAMFDQIIAESGWASFGRIAAESDLARKF